MNLINQTYLDFFKAIVFSEKIEIDNEYDDEFNLVCSAANENGAIKKFNCSIKLENDKKLKDSRKLYPIYEHGNDYVTYFKTMYLKLLHSDNAHKWDIELLVNVYIDLINQDKVILDINTPKSENIITMQLPYDSKINKEFINFLNSLSDSSVTKTNKAVETFLQFFENDEK